MTLSKMPLALLSVLALGLLACGALQRDNPMDPGRRPEAGVDLQAAPSPALRIVLAVPKALRSVVYRVEAVLTGPDIQPVVEQLTVSPLGPAVGSIGALQPGIERTLTVTGYDLADQPLFTGSQHHITIAVGETTAVHLHLELVPSRTDGSAGTGSAGAGSGDSG